MDPSASQTDSSMSVDEELKKLVKAEMERRSEFSQKLGQLVARRNEEQSCGEQTTVGELWEMMDRTEATISSQLQDLCVGHAYSDPSAVSRRGRVHDANQKRDSGYSSVDMSTTRRQGVHLRASVVPTLPSENAANQALPEMLEPSSLPTGCTALEGHVTGEPTEHSDSSVDDMS